MKYYNNVKKRRAFHSENERNLFSKFCKTLRKTYQAHVYKAGCNTADLSLQIFQMFTTTIFSKHLQASTSILTICYLTYI